MCIRDRFNLVTGILGDIMKTKLSKTLLTAVLTSIMAVGTGTSLVAQDQSMDKPSAGVSAQVAVSYTHLHWEWGRVPFF